VSSSFVLAKDTTFELNGSPFHVYGVNCYFLAYCSDKSRRDAIATAKTLGANTIRTWAFLALGEDPESRLAQLDAVIAAADSCGIKLILPLINHWEDFGGMPAYVRSLGTGLDVTTFYRSPVLRAAYQDWIHRVLTRRNTFTGRLYSEEPAILAWELTNEARCATAGGRELIIDWITQMSSVVKQLDSGHLLALGDEGFFYRKGRGHLYDGTYGMDWEANLALPNMDFGTYHFYPQDWGVGDRPAFARKWIRDHATVAAKLNKPVILEEYGLKTPERRRVYETWQEIIHITGTAGSLVWMLGHQALDTSGYKDDYVLYL